MPPDPEAFWTLAPVPPGVDGGDWHVEVFREVFDGEEPVE